MANDKILFSMDLTALMAIEKIAKESQRSPEDVLVDFMKSNTAKCCTTIRINFGGMAPTLPLKNSNGKRFRYSLS